MEQDGTYSCKSIKLYELDRQWAYFAATTLLIEPCGLEELSSYGIDSLVDVVNRLRGPSGCPWDREQTHKSIEASLIEESYEVIDAIAPIRTMTASTYQAVSGAGAGGPIELMVSVESTLRFMIWFAMRRR